MERVINFLDARGRRIARLGEGATRVSQVDLVVDSRGRRFPNEVNNHLPGEFWFVRGIRVTRGSDASKLLIPFFNHRPRRYPLM